MGNADRVQAQVVGSKRKHHRVQPVGPQANGPTPRMGAGSGGPSILPMEGVQGRPR